MLYVVLSETPKLSDFAENQATRYRRDPRSNFSQLLPSSSHTSFSSRPFSLVPDPSLMLLKPLELSDGHRGPLVPILLPLLFSPFVFPVSAHEGALDSEISVPNHSRLRSGS